MSDDFNSDKKSEKPDSEDSSKDETVDQLKEELGKTSEKIEKMEEKIIEQQKKAFSLRSNSKSEAITVILAIILTGLGHFYLHHFKRGAIFLGIGLAFIALNFVFEFFVFISIPFWIFNIYDAYKKCKFYNNFLAETGKKPE